MTHFKSIPLITTNFSNVLVGHAAKMAIDDAVSNMSKQDKIVSASVKLLITDDVQLSAKTDESVNELIKRLIETMISPIIGESLSVGDLVNLACDFMIKYDEILGKCYMQHSIEHMSEFNYPLGMSGVVIDACVDNFTNVIGYHDLRLEKCEFGMAYKIININTDTCSYNFKSISVSDTDYIPGVIPEIQQQLASAAEHCENKNIHVTRAEVQLYSDHLPE